MATRNGTLEADWQEAYQRNLAEAGPAMAGELATAELEVYCPRHKGYRDECRCRLPRNFSARTRELRRAARAQS